MFMSTIEQTFFIIKPDAIEKKHIGDIFTAIEKNNLTVKQLKIVQATPALLQQHYAHLVNKPFFNSMVAYLTRQPVIIGILEGPNAILAWRRLMGATDPKDAENGTLRAIYGDSATMENVVHGSDSPEAVIKESELWFNE